VLNPEKIRYQ